MTHDCTVMLLVALGALIFLVALTTETLGGARKSSSRIKSRVPAPTRNSTASLMADVVSVPGSSVTETIGRNV
jgi:hypothetical protein